MTKINIDTNEAICLQCDDIGYIHLRKGLEKTNIEWTVLKEMPQIEWRDKFETHFVHSLHSHKAKNNPMSITFILTHPGRLRAELSPPPPPRGLSPLTPVVLDTKHILTYFTLVMRAMKPEHLL